MTSSNSFSKLSNTVLLLSIIGVVFSTILVFHHTAIVNNLSDGPSSCAINETINCDKVAESKYSAIAGIPIGSFALLFYLTMLTTVAVSKWSKISTSSRLANFYFFSSAIALVPTLMLIFISAVHIKAVCLYCLVLQIINFTFFIVCLFSKAVERNLAKGFSSVFYFFSRDTGDLALRRTAQILFFVTAFAVYVLPSFFRIEILEPLHIAKMKKTVDSSVPQSQQLLTAEKEVWEEWQKLAPVDLGINTTTDLENRDFSLGSDTAKVRIVSFSDFECPHCKKAAEIFHALFQQYSDKVEIVFKNYPLDKSCNTAMQSEGHKFACQAAIAARCAGREGEDFFWEAHDYLFSGTIDQNLINSIPEKLGLDKDKFDQCVKEPRSLERLLVDVTLGQQLKLQGTPSIFVNDRQISDPATLYVIINNLLTEK